MQDRNWFRFTDVINCNPGMMYLSPNWLGWSWRPTTNCTGLLVKPSAPKRGYIIDWYVAWWTSHMSLASVKYLIRNQWYITSDHSEQLYFHFRLIKVYYTAVCFQKKLLLWVSGYIWRNCAYIAITLIQWSVFLSLVLICLHHGRGSALSSECKVPICLFSGALDVMMDCQFLSCNMVSGMKSIKCKLI